MMQALHHLFLGMVLIASMLPFAVGANSESQTVVLISLDGFRHDYIEKHGAANLARIAEKGVRAKGLVPVFPANTFPNHLSVITGLNPVNHGIVNNSFYDKTRLSDKGYAQYSMGDGKKDSTWITGIPLWNLVEFHDRRAATFFWPESDARINGTVPSYYYPYSKYADYDERVNQILQWLSLPEATRPQFVAGYFSLVDSVGHDAGPDAAQTKAAVQAVDALVGRLYDQIQGIEYCCQSGGGI